MIMFLFPRDVPAWGDWNWWERWKWTFLKANHKNPEVILNAILSNLSNTALLFNWIVKGKTRMSTEISFLGSLQILVLHKLYPVDDTFYQVSLYVYVMASWSFALATYFLIIFVSNVIRRKIPNESTVPTAFKLVKTSNKTRLLFVLRVCLPISCN